MRDTSTEERLGSPQRPVRMSDVLRALVVLAFGCYVIYTAGRPTTLPLSYTFRLAWGSLMVVYALYRLFRALPFSHRKPRPDDFS